MLDFIIVNPSRGDGPLHIVVDKITAIRHYIDDNGTNCTIHTSGDWFPVKENPREVLSKLEKIRHIVYEASARHK